ncbi:hypothetical protein HWC80_gp019 [Mycobacterium phage Indlulamithi]|uniref:Uncharacterized protein n=1 Tax=Mycobacterium phage Indlulamithi TaxID=2656582 RepID=A0A649VCI2_9CAUD|nr:hypothetical protein HWC80_gp019 [Mycobacterium phage Indlulamithi]QGJ90060.1 hypothetical protein PBI_INDLULAMITHI_19 [Mycobacterium phage Indlulamithi]
MPDANDFANEPALPGDSTPQEATAPQKQEELTDEQKAEKARQGLPPSVEVVTADAPMELQKPIKADESKGFIQYVGVATTRQMTPADWEREGVDDFDQFIEWNYLNKKCVPRSIFTDKALQYLLRVDGRFKLVDKRPEK